MTIYHKFINGCMLNNYDLGDISEEEAFAQGYKTMNEPPKDGKMYCAKTVEETEHHLEVEWEEIPIPVSEAENDG